MGKLYSLISALFIAAGSAFAAGPAAYEWWFDNDVSTAQTGTVTGEQFDIQIDASALPKGAHYFNCRLSTDEGEYGSVYRKMFYNIADKDGDIGCSYEYWFDNDHTTKVSGDLTGGTNTFDIDITSLPPGTHYFNCRLNRTDGEWGAVYRKMFYNVSNTGGVVSYEYWIDDNYAAKQTGDITEGSRSFDVSLAGIVPGAHYFNCRLYNNMNGWGATYRKMVFTTGTEYDAVAYEYWIDDNYAARNEGELGTGENTYEVDLTGVRKGLHRFNYRLRNGAGVWGSVYSKYFYYASAKAPFTNYEYWLDDDYANRKTAHTDSNPVTFDIDLTGFDKSGGAHYFNLRVRDDDGEWSSFYRKAIVFYDSDTKAPVIGYRHYINDIDLGYVEVNRQITDSYTFAVDVPESFRLSIRDKQPVFADDLVTIAGNDSVQYLMQVRTEAGWAPPAMWDIELDNSFTTTAVEMTVNSMHTFTTPVTGEFAAVKFTAAGTPLYFRADAAIALDLYRAGNKVAEITSAELTGMKQLQLEAGEYFGIFRDADAGAPDRFTFHLMDTPNAAPTPVIEFKNGMVTISCSREDAEIYYTLDGSMPVPAAEGSTLYERPFPLDHNTVVKAISIVPDSDLNPSAVAEENVNFYKVAAPSVRFENLTIIITQEQREGVTTHYTLDGRVPDESSSLYEGPFSLTGDAKVCARSFKEGYNPSEPVTFTYTHAAYITKAPRIEPNDQTITLTPVTEGSTIFYSIDKPAPEDMQEYTAPFTMSGNGTVYAQARKEGMYDSEVVEYTVSGRTMPRPEISRVEGTDMIRITCPHQNAEIRYTTDGTKPDRESNLYTEEFEFDRNGTIRAIAIDKTGNLLDSENELVIDDKKVGDPTFSFEHLRLIITQDSKEGVSTYYTIDGESPTEKDNLYTGPISLTEAVKTVYARSYKDNYHSSETVLFRYNHADYVTGAPEFKAAGNIIELIPTTEGSTIFYGIEESEPEKMQPYTEPFKMETNGTVYAQARMEDMYDSEVVSHTVSVLTMPRPEISRVEGTDMIRITCPHQNAEIRYTTDGTRPDRESTLYTEEFGFDRNGTITAIAVDKTGNLLDSEPVSLTISGRTMPRPEISRVEGTDMIRITCPHQNAEIRYTTDGTKPDRESNLYTEEFGFDRNGTITAIAIDKTGNLLDSEPVSLTISGRTMPRPEISRVEGTDMIRITCPHQNAEIRYTTDGTKPDRESNLYTEEFGFDRNGTITAIAVDKTENLLDSEPVSLVIDDKKVGDPEFSFEHLQLVITQDSKEDVRTYYTLDGTPPTENANLYTGPISLTEDVKVVYARSYKDNYHSSKTVPFRYNHADYVTGAPEFKTTGDIVELIPTTEGSNIFYAIDESEPEKMQPYTEPFKMETNGTVYAQARMEDMYDSEVVSHTVSDLAMPRPEISRVEGTDMIRITCPHQNAEIRYTTDGTKPDGNSTLYTEEFEFDRNGTIRAIAIDKTGNLLDSENELVIDDKKVSDPKSDFNPQTRLLSLYCDTENAEISYTFDADGEWTTYSDPIALEKNCTVYAKAVVPNYLDSETVPIIVDNIRCYDVEIGYNGRYLTFNTDEEGAVIYYTLDGSHPTESSDIAEDKVDACGIGKVRAIAVRSGILNSEEAEYPIHGYADETHAVTDTEGVLRSCYDWAEPEVINSMERLKITGRLNSDDYAYIRSMTFLRHLDLTEITDEIMPEKALANTHLVSVTMPETLKEYNSGTLSGNDALCAVIWKSVYLELPDKCKEDVSNPNLLFYLPDGASGNKGERNIVTGTRAESVVLTDGYPFYAPLAFTADAISYTRRFGKQTVFNTPAGWETLALPFDVDSISDSRSNITPFAIAGENDRPFWLLSPEADNWKDAESIRAYEPYLISMPNNPEYRDDYNISGDVVFTASGTIVRATPEPQGFSCISGTEMWPDFTGTAAEENVLAVNDDWYEGFWPGSVFVRNLRDVRPFECYITSDSSPYMIPMFDNSRIEEITGDTGIRVWSRNHDLYILSGRQRSIPIYNLRGLLIRTVEVKAGETVRISDLVPDLYLVGRTKVMIH